MTPPVVSVIIPAFNCERYIAETLDAVLDQTYSSFEVLVVNDGSTDRQQSIVDEYAKRDNRVQCIRQTNQGVSAARNNGYRNSLGKFVAFLDADDLWHRDNLARKVEMLENSDVMLVHSDGLIIDEASRVLHGVLSGIEGNLLDPLLLWEGTQIPGPSSILVKREAVDAVGGFDENLSTSADKDFFIRIASRFLVGKVSEVTWRYRKHFGNMHKNISLMEHDVLYLYRKASRMKMFSSRAFERKCYSTMYLILAASWAGDGRNWWKGFWYFLHSVANNPAVVFQVLKKIVRKWR
jgi:glycosyltransferase involved in cell wall biosynthesis